MDPEAEMGRGGESLVVAVDGRGPADQVVDAAEDEPAVALLLKESEREIWCAGGALAPNNAAGDARAAAVVVVVEARE